MKSSEVAAVRGDLGFRLEKLLQDLSEVWEAHGKDGLTKLAVSGLGRLATISHGLLRRDVFVGIEQKAPGNLGCLKHGRR